jgi:hypothetical protein
MSGTVLQPELSQSNAEAFIGNPNDTILSTDNLENVSVNGLSDSEVSTVRELFKTWRRHFAGNRRRSAFYDAHNAFMDFGISIPPKILNSVDNVLDWPRMVVRALADMNVFNGFSSPVADGVPFGLDEIVYDNDLDVELPQAIVSTYKHSCAFLTVAGGDVQSGEPSIVVAARAADWSAALWDGRRRRISAALAITDASQGVPTAFTVYLSDYTISCVKKLGVWRVERRQPNPLNTPLVEPLRYDPQLNRPFGRSRISRPVIGLTNAGFRTFVRMEATAEFYTAPQLWFLGLNDDAFGGEGKWSAMYGHANSVSKDEDGDVPSIHQIQQATMQPHLDSLSMITRMVAASSNLPASAFGIVSDNPESAEAMDTAYRRLIREAEAQNRLFSHALVHLGQKAVLLRDNETVVSDELRSLVASFERVSLQSPAAAADAFSKYAGVIPGFAQSDVGLHFAGFNSDQIASLKQSADSATAKSTLDRLLNGAASDNQGTGRSAQQGTEARGATGSERDAGAMANSTEHEPGMAA